MSVAQDVWCVRVVHLNRNHSSAYLAGETWKSLFVSSKQGKDFYLRGAVGSTSGIIDDCYLTIKGAW